MATISAYIILPWLTYNHIIKSSADKHAWNDMILRHTLLIFAMIEGLLTGHVLSNLTLHSLSPIAALTPCFVGIVTPIIQPIIRR
ncbi:unnamed protein product [Onchocerca flexuosa]|uniref:Cytochrome b561 domain-containing protein n=1 Tax=Onchocerca flexuosa TaxID=387005 RepID=A0A183HVN1_9BILA|nr:unnamed protein product [Onchocerca flexuosa]